MTILKKTAARMDPRVLFHRCFTLTILIYTGLIIFYYFTDFVLGEKLWLIDALSYVHPWLFLPSLLFLLFALFFRSRILIIVATIPEFPFLASYDRLFLPQRTSEDNGLS